MPYSIIFDGSCYPRAITARRLLPMLLLLPALLLGACGRQAGYAEYGAPPYGIGESPSLAPSHYYPPPGPPGDPWGPYIREAAARYNVPEQWVRAVMQQESGGQEQAVSPVGAMGLMQVMPETYDGLRMRYGLGEDPYDPHNNILAGTAYIREMYDRFGAPGFLAAYNAGPNRVDSYLTGASDLPDETVNYVAAITPNLGSAVPLSGPLAVYASARGGGSSRFAPSVASLAAGCDLNAAYDPNHPCTSLMQAAAAPSAVQTASAQQTGANGCDLSAAFDPNHPCSSVGQVAAMAAAPQPQQAVVRQAAAPAPVQTAFAQQTGTDGCDLSAAYDPNHPCTSGTQVAAVSPAAPVFRLPPQPAAPEAPPRLQLASAEGCDPNAAFDPDNPCHMAASAGGGAVPAPAAAEPDYAEPVYPAAPFAGYRPAAPQASASAAPAPAGRHLLAIPNRNWAIQVGAFANPALARAVAEGARAQAPDQLRAAIVALPPTPTGGSVLYRARLARLSASAASDACWRLNQRQLPCVVVQPNRS